VIGFLHLTTVNAEGGSGEAISVNVECVVSFQPAVVGCFLILDNDSGLYVAESYEHVGRVIKNLLVECRR
jgi:hypothetical protein